MKPGDKILVGMDMTGLVIDLPEYTITKVTKDFIICGSSENTFYRAVCWPIKYKEELTTILKERSRLRSIYEDSFKLVLELANKISRENKQ